MLQSVNAQINRNMLNIPSNVLYHVKHPNMLSCTLKRIRQVVLTVTDVGKTRKLESLSGTKSSLIAEQLCPIRPSLVYMMRL